MKASLICALALGSLVGIASRAASLSEEDCAPALVQRVLKANRPARASSGNLLASDDAWFNDILSEMSDTRFGTCTAVYDSDELQYLIVNATAYFAEGTYVYLDPEYKILDCRSVNGLKKWHR